MIRRLMAVSAIALMAAACNKPAPTTASSEPAAAESSIAAAQPDAHPSATIPTPADEAAAPDFVQKAAVSDMFEVQSSKLALKRSTNKEVKDFARMMVADHTKSTAALKAAIKESGQSLTPPAALPDDKAKDLDDLAKADAKDFDKAYMDAQEDGHHAALDLLARYSKDGDVPALKAFADKIAPTVQMHLDKAKAIKDALK